MKVFGRRFDDGADLAVGAEKVASCAGSGLAGRPGDGHGLRAGHGDGGLLTHAASRSVSVVVRAARRSSTPPTRRPAGPVQQGWVCRRPEKVTSRRRITVVLAVSGVSARSAYVRSQARWRASRSLREAERSHLLIPTYVRFSARVSAPGHRPYLSRLTEGGQSHRTLTTRLFVSSNFDRQAAIAQVPVVELKFTHCLRPGWRGRRQGPGRAVRPAWLPRRRRHGPRDLNRLRTTAGLLELLRAAGRTNAARFPLSATASAITDLGRRLT